MSVSGSRHSALAETAATYGGTAASVPHVKLSISLPAELVDEVRAAAADTQSSVSAVIAAALRSSIATSDQAWLDRALEMDAEDNADWASDALVLTARAWADLEW